MKPERIIVCGGRDFTDEAFVFMTLTELRQYFANRFAIIQGEAKGADRLAKKWAISEGICCIGVSAPWDMFGLSAGGIRNEWMNYFCLPQLVIAFPGGKGTASMVRIAKSSGVPVHAL